jgi:hypothetical protein
MDWDNISLMITSAGDLTRQLAARVGGRTVIVPLAGAAIAVRSIHTVPDLMMLGVIIAVGLVVISLADILLWCILR